MLIRKERCITMSYARLLTATNIAFIIGGVYFALLVALGETGFFSIVPVIMCFLSFALGVRDQWFFSEPWRLATAVFVLVLLVVQEGANAVVVTGVDLFTIGSIAVNGGVLLVFVGVALSCLRVITRGEEEGEMDAQTRKITA